MRLSTDLLRQLRLLKLQPKSQYRGRLKGERRSRNHGVGLEFADYRPYQTGDDLTHVDWNLYARSGRRFIKLFQAEANLTVSFLIDSSSSMGLGNPTKLDLAKQIVTALGYVALANFDQVQIYTCRQRLLTVLPSTYSKTQFPKVVQALVPLSAEGQTDLEGCLKQFAEQNEPGIVILISDFFDNATYAYQRGLISLVGQQFEVTAIQILCRAEQQPNFSGEVQLTDIETGKSKEIAASTQVLAGYQRRLQQFLARTVQFCHDHAITYLLTTNESSLEQVILHDLRQTGLVQ